MTATPDPLEQFNAYMDALGKPQVITNTDAQHRLMRLMQLYGQAPEGAMKEVLHDVIDLLAKLIGQMEETRH